MSEYSIREKGALRPLWHFSAPHGWINDPNGFCFFKGYYHLFYQYNPKGCDWHEMHWGHARSKDLLHWEDLPIALYPDRDYDSDPSELSGGCFSGSALVKGGRLYVFYTGTSRHGGSVVQAQCMAYSDDGINFTKYENNPIIPHPPANVGETANFRDPRIVEKDGRYYLLVGTTQGGLKVGDGRILLYASEDIFHWTYKGVLLECGGEWTSMCECPDLFEMNGRWVLSFSLMHAVNAEKVICAVGQIDFDGCRFNIEKTGEFDYGMDFYASQTMEDPKGRRIIIGWAGSWWWLPWFNNYGPTAHENWRGFMSLPRKVTMGSDNTPRLYPVEEFESILRAPGVEKAIEVSDKKMKMEVPDSGAYCLRMEIPRSEILANALEIGTKAYGDKATIIRVDFEKSSVALDRRAGDNAYLPKGKTVRFFTLEEDLIEIMILVDRCSVETFIEHGKVCMTTTVYPKDEKQGLWFRAEAGTMRLKDVSISEIAL